MFYRLRLVNKVIKLNPITTNSKVFARRPSINNIVPTRFTNLSSKHVKFCTSISQQSTMANNSNQSENRLAKEKSPYLLQHKHNPVEWYAWGQEAFEKARKEDKLIFLSVGYSTCHWCHVMNTESFENPATAEIMNNNFVNIKLDREERPDVDKIYMTYIQAISGGGGWPMSVWLTPDLKPIFGGTYFPPKDAYGRPGFPTLLQWIADKWKNAREDLNQQAEKVIRLIKESQEEKESQDISLNELPITKCFDQIAKSYEPFYGGFGEAPKFPRPVVFNLLFQCVAKDPNSVRGSKALEMINHTLIKMGEGGMFDHLDGGFHRYSVTKDWHIPHFEKMLYDQGQLVNSYLDAFLVTHDPFFEKRARDVLDYVLKCLTSKEGGFYSAEDADSIIEHGKKEHAEGAFYVWTSDQIAEIITDPKELKVFNYHFGVKDNGNVAPGADPHGELAGKNHLKITHSIKDTAQDFELTQEEVQDIINRNCKKLNEVREKRPRPHLDDKIITAWNGLMISAYARAYQVLNDNKYLQAAEKATQFIYDNLYNKDSKTLIRNYREGPSNIRAFTDDYAFLISGLLDLYEASFNLKWLKWAIELQETQNKLFWDDANGGYFAVEEGDKNLVLRMKEDYDGAEPCNNSVSAHNLVRLEQFTGNEFFRTCAELIFRQFSKQLSQTPITIPQMCVALSYYIDKPRQIVIAGQLTNDDTKEMLREVNSNFIPNKIVLLADQGPNQAYLAENLPFIKDMKMINGKATAYVCENYACNLPVNSVSELKKLLTKSK